MRLFKSLDSIFVLVLVIIYSLTGTYPPPRQDVWTMRKK